jgi:peptidoglycan/LPS O-acetylase OafA/YrhL
MSESIQKKSHRRYDLDWLRVFAVLLLIYFHSAAVFYQGELGEFYITNPDKSSVLRLFVLAIHQWHMPLFFFLAGAASWYSLQIRGARQYLSERGQRLAIPLVVGILTLVSPQVYLNRLNQGLFQGSFLDFYPHFFNGIRPTGNFEWAHLWFIAYLLVLSIAALPVFLYLKRDDCQIWLQTVSKQILEFPGLLSLAIPLALIEAIFRPRWPGFQNLYDDWANVLLYFVYLVYGYLVYGYTLSTNSTFETQLEQHRPKIISLAILGMTILLSLWITDAVPARSYSLAYMSYQALRGFNSWCWIVALLSIAQHFLQVQNRWLHYLNEASYPIYLIHQTIVVTIAFYIVRWNTTITIKFMFISTASLVLTLLVYELLIRRWQPIQVLFGLKPTQAS